ncbi:helitron helicase-like domain-containing protein [Artemisia annua]|uniref:Helitron helicase-like domain-containing protein n=1 Tax=Artemisia annua TaxID=35608 RepID=A0A2U1MD54_ARTAN|nr:helitron helicase-like domain-containing protein [Artemisia annua]
MARDMPMEDPHPFGFDSSLTYNHGLSTSDGGLGGSDARYAHLNESGHPQFLNAAFTGGSGPSQSHIFLVDAPQASAPIVRSPYGVREGRPLMDVPNGSFDGSVSSVAGLATPLNPVSGSPAEAITVDGLVSTFIPTNIVREPFQTHTDARSSQVSFAVPTPFSIPGVSRDVPMTLIFTTGQIDRNGVSGPWHPDAFDADALPVQGPLAPPQRQGAPLDYKRFGGCDMVCQYCHALFWSEEKRSGMSASVTPQYQRCCAGGRVILPSYGEYPAYIVDLYSDRHFMDNIRAYNQMFAMTSFGDDNPRFLQMYIYDTDHEVRHRLSHFDPHERRVLRENIVQGLIQFLNNHNALVHLFRTARDKLREADIPEFEIRLFGVVGGNQYDLPTADTIGAIVYDGGPETITDYDVVIQHYIGYIHNVEKVKEYGGSTGNKIKLRNIGIRNLKYNESNTVAPQLEIQTERFTNWEQERTRNRVALGTLLQIDPNTQQRVLFTQEVMILRIDDTYEWYYEKCDECGGKLTYGFVHGHCHQYGTQPKPQKSYSFRLVMTDGTGNATIACFSPQTEGLIKDIDTLLEEVADKSPEIIPAQILALQNTRHVFQFRFAKPVGKGAPTFILQKVMDHMPSLLPTITEGPSTPPTASTYDDSAIHSSPPPATPLATQETPTDVATVTCLPDSSNVRKELFTASIEEETSPQAKKQKTD